MDDTTCQASSISTPDQLNEYLRQKSIIGMLFSGWYTDRVWVEEIKEYRDRIRVDPEETDVVKCLKSVFRRVKKQDLGKKSFCGLERLDDQMSILLNWDESSSHPFGHFWFLIEEVTFINKGLRWKVKVLRSVLQNDSNGKCPHCGKYPTDSVKESAGDEDPLNMTEIANTMQKKFVEVVNPVEWYHDAKQHLTCKNIVNSVKFVVILIMALITGIGQMLPKMWQLLNVTLRESGNLLKNIMPFLLACVEMINKMVGGFYLLVAMMWRDSGKKNPPPNSSPYKLENKSRSYFQSQSYPYHRENIQRPYLRHQQ